MHTNASRPAARGRAAATGAMLFAATLPAAPLAGQEHTHTHADDHGLHFTHPLFAESVSPDRKLRLDYAFQDLGADDAGEVELEGEYAFMRAFSIEAGVHFDSEAAEFGETHVIFKFANYAFEESGVLLGYGLDLSLPTGTAHAHGGVHEEEAPGHDEVAGGDEDIYEITPFLNAGWLSGAWELVGWALFEIPTNQDDQRDVGTELRYHGSLLYHAGSRIQLLLETLGRAGLSGPASDETTVNLAPGLRVRPLTGSSFVVGAGLALPINDTRDFDTQLLVSAFYHF